MASWWPIQEREHHGRKCMQCGSMEGLTADDQGRVFCYVHRNLHDMVWPGTGGASTPDGRLGEPMREHVFEEARPMPWLP
jgi:hypothetical protein